MWYATRNPRSFATGDGPVEPTDPFGLKRTWDLGPVYERDGVTTKVFGQSAAAQAYTVNTHYQVTAGPASMSWNDNGYLIARGDDDFAWTALGQFAQADIDGGDTLDYTYDAFGRRVKTVNDSQVNRFLYHGWHMIGEWDDTADEWLWQEAPWNEGERMLEHIALDTSDVDTDVNVSEYRQYAVHEDFQDTVWGLSDTSAAIAERYNYSDPYGQSDSEDGSANTLGELATQVFNRKRLHGGLFLPEEALADFRSRQFLLSLGVWNRRDPLGLIDSTNQYQALLASPTSITDPFGLDCEPGCNPSTCPCASEKTRMVDEMKAAMGSSGLSLTAIASAEALIKSLEDAIVNCGDCGPGTPCAFSGKGRAGRSRIVVCYKKVLHPAGVAGPFKIPPYESCQMCCKADCEKILAHEWMHLICLDAGNSASACDHWESDSKDWTETGMAIYNCLKDPSNCNFARTKELFESLPKKPWWWPW